MRYSLILLLVLAQFAHGAWTIKEQSSPPSPPKTQFQRVEITNGTDQVRMNVVLFSSADCTLALMDDPEGVFDLASASRKRGALAAVNGGYFHPDRTPLGLRIRKGREIHPLERAKLLSGAMVIRGSEISLVRMSELKGTSKLQEAVQAGPFLVDRGLPVSGLDGSRKAARTVIVAGSQPHFALVTLNSTTLKDAGAILATPSLFGKWNVVRALNLDGGSSTGLWVGGTEPFYQREWRDVRDFVAIVPR